MSNVQKCDQCNARVAPYGMRVNSFCKTWEYKCNCGYSWQDYSDIVSAPNVRKEPIVKVAPLARICEKCTYSMELNSTNWHLDAKGMPVITWCKSCVDLYGNFKVKAHAT